MMTLVTLITALSRVIDLRMLGNALHQLQITTQGSVRWATVACAQVHQAYYRNAVRCIQLTMQEEGLRGFTRGLGATMAREVPGNALFFCTYEAAKQHINAALRIGQPSAVDMHWNVAEATSGCASHRSVQQGSRPTGHATAAAAAHKGCGSNAQLRAAVGSASARAHGAQQAGSLNSERRSWRERLKELCGMVLAGGTAGCVMWATVLPIDAAKTRIQAASKGSADDVGIAKAMQRMWVQRGLRGMWAGLGPTLLRAFPANAAQWIVWELSTATLR